MAKYQHIRLLLLVQIHSDTELPFNPELAKQLMAEAGYSESNPFPKLEILFNTNEDHRKIALAIQRCGKKI